MTTDLLLGFIPPSLRTQKQADAHAAATAKMPRFTLAPVKLAKGESVRLFDAYNAPAVVADIGFVFSRFHQLTGSCVGAGGGNAEFSLIATQRVLPTNPTKAFVPFWPFNYGRARLYMGDRNQGEGALGSTLFKSLVEDGTISASEPGLPQFQDNDGLILTSSLEMTWSDGDSQTVTKWLPTAKGHGVGATAEIKDIASLNAAIVNGYPCTFACNNYVGNASVQGSGANARVVGYWDTYGPHQQSVHAVEEHPDFGPIYWVQNNWPGSVYPKDPAGGPVCGCWVKESKVEAAMRLDAEVFALSHLQWFVVQPEVMSWFV